MFKKRSRLLSGVLCAMLAAMLIVPAAAHGGHHRGVRQNAQTIVTA